MDGTGFGAYAFYFRFQRFVGAFPYHVENTGTSLSVYRHGFFKWLYYINFIAIVFGAAFQFVQLMLTIQYEPDPIHVIAQLCWMFAMCIPLANMIAYITKEEKVAQSVDSWCTLERTVIGSSLRGLPSMPNGPLPTMSACHTAQSRLFIKTAAVYLLMTVSAVIGMALHFHSVPRFPAYVYTVTTNDEPIILFYLAWIYQVWLVLIICTHVFGTEVIMVVASGSIVHCLETLSYRGAVVMANNQCDVPHFSEVLIKNWAAFEAKGASGNSKTAFSNTAAEKSQEKVSKALEPANESGNKGYDDDHLSSVVQNVVDIQYALDRYKDIEAVVDSLNNAFGKMLFKHQSVYMMLMCTLFYTPIRHLQILPVEGSMLFSSIALYYCIRLFIFFPSMGRVNVMSSTFVESWMEGLRDIPRGKYAYEFYMHKLESCRKLAFDAGGFYLMQKGTVLTFVSIVTTNIIVLLQLY